jgi:FtsP/CotA-like multicopper oxidase with cupredoxin domain/peroxiredoxin
VTSRPPGDLPAFNWAVLALFSHSLIPGAGKVWRSPMGNRSSTWIGLLCVIGAVAIIYAWHFPGEDPENAAVIPAGTPEPKPQPPKPPPEQESLARAATEPFAEAEAIRSVDGLLRATLAVQYGDNVIRGSHVHLRSYNGRLVGPTLRTKPGDVLKIRVENRLPQVPEPPVHTVNVPHGLNSTNVHTHGLHVSPEGNSDNVYLDIKPGQAQDYEITIPKDHVAGTFFYHPHKHGSVALQMSSGMSGALIVEGGLDEVPEIKQARERIFLFHQIPFDDEGRVEKLTNLYDGHPTKHWHASGRFTTINGVALPVLALRPGEVQRWRFIHSGIHESLTVRLDGHDLHEIATDGIPLGGMVPREEIELQPGNRSDVLVKASATPGVYLLRDGALPADRALRAIPEPEKLLAKVVVAGPPRNMALPDSAGLARFAPFKPITDEEVQGRKATVVFGQDEKHQPPRYFINDRQFDPDVIPRRVLVGTAEEWTLSSKEDNHPFHLHVNPFEVIRRDPQTGAIVDRVWKDTILVTEKKPVTIRVRYLDFSGKSVFHCHNLAHEDLGMMQNIEVVRTPAELKETGGLLLPWRPPAWELADAAGRWHRSEDLKGRPALLVFFQGGTCPHCLRQLKVLHDYAGTPGAADLRVVAVSPEPRAALARTQKWLGGDRILLVSDETAGVFGRFHCRAEGGLRHGLFLLNPEGQVVWYRISAEALTDVTPLRLALEMLTER